MKKYIVFAFVIALTTVSLLAQTGPRRNRQAGNEGPRRGRQTNNDAAPNNNGSFVVGKNRFTTQVNGDTREYYVHVPRGYNSSTPTPVVFMLHGSSGNGLKFYNISGWKELGEAENIITVYPSSWHYCIVEDNQRKNTTKWNILPGASFSYCPGETPRDDVKFLNQAIDELEQKFNVNQKMIYTVGFSNGGQMTARIGVEMSDRVAAIVSDAGFLTPGTTYTAKRLLPVLLQVGTNDDRYMGLSGGAPLPMNFDQLFAQSQFFKGEMQSYSSTYKLNPKYTTSGDPNNIVFLDAKGVSGDPNNVLRFALMKGVEHQYPNGKNNPIQAAKLNWQWLKQFKLP